jgi:hypothetical protein
MGLEQFTSKACAHVVTPRAQLVKALHTTPTSNNRRLKESSIYRHSNKQVRDLQWLRCGASACPMNRYIHRANIAKSVSLIGDVVVVGNCFAFHNGSLVLMPRRVGTRGDRHDVGSCCRRHRLCNAPLGLAFGEPWGNSADSAIHVLAVHRIVDESPTTDF